MLDSGNQIYILKLKNLKLTMFMFKMMECLSKPYHIKNVHRREVVVNQHHWELEQKKTDDLEVTKVDKSNWVKTIENIVFHLNLMRRVRAVPLANVVRQHV